MALLRMGSEMLSATRESNPATGLLLMMCIGLHLG